MGNGRRLLIAATVWIGLASSAVAMPDVDRRLMVALSNYFFEPAPAEAAIAAGANVNARNEAMNDETLLILAIKGRAAPEVVKFLIDRGADPSLRDGSGKTALDWATQYGIGSQPEGRRIMAMLAPAAPVAAPNAAARSVPAPASRLAGAAPAAGQRPAPASLPQPRQTAAAPARGGAPAPGVYECINQQAMISPLAFGIIDGTTYMSSGGRRGRYSYDAASGVLTLDPGSNPARYQRISATTFRLLKPDGQLGGFTCPLNRAKNPSRPPW